VAHTYSCCLSLENQSMKEGSLFVLSVLYCLFTKEGCLLVCFILFVNEGMLFTCLFYFVCL
jgi:hypothetical protein